MKLAVLFVAVTVGVIVVWVNVRDYGLRDTLEALLLASCVAVGVLALRALAEKLS